MQENSKRKKLHTKKASRWIRYVVTAKKILYKCFGKARWYLLALFLIFSASLFIVPNYGLRNLLPGVREDDKVLKETPLRDVTEFSCNDTGRAVTWLEIGDVGMVAFFSPDTGETLYAGTGEIVLELLGYDGCYVPSDFSLGDNGKLYAIRLTYEDTVASRNIVRESVVQISDTYEQEKEVFVRTYDVPGGHRTSGFSRLHFADGMLSFATVDRDSVYTYRYDPAAEELCQSREYPTEEDGTYTVSVIPIDGAFLFFRSNGEVYRTGFDEPMGECIAHFDPMKDEPLFTQAVLCGEELFAFDEEEPTKVYRLEDGAFSGVLDIRTVSGYADRKIRYIDSYRGQDGKQMLILCLEDGLLIWSDGQLEEKNVLLKNKPTIINYLWAFIESLSFLLAGALLINLLIRKKTLFYKRILMTVPVFMVVIIVVSVKVYDKSNNQNNQNIRNEMEMITKFGAREMEGYDFSGLLKTDENTGGEYHRLYEQIRKINTDRRKEWSRNYVFSVLYRTGDTSAAILLDDDTVTMPMEKELSIASEKEFRLYDGVGDFYVSENLTGFFADEANQNEMAAYARIRDANGSGRIYLKVSTDIRRFWYQRQQLIVMMITYVTLWIVFLTLLIMLASLYITRAIKKASGVVQKIAEGDFSARVSYRSKDELGEICTEVNAMGRNLEELFQEKDRTEKFYYKFVPEQFCELLGKENFTDLELGDSAGRELTVLSCDIRSFSINSEIMTAKENFEFVNVIYGIAGPIIRMHGGFVDKYIGDAVVALFENAGDAIKCGIEIYRAIVLDPQTAERLGISDINIGIGIHSGQARVGIVGERERLAGAVISEIVDLSAHLEGMTKQYQTAMLISQETVDRLDDPEQFKLRCLGSVQITDAEDAVTIYEVLDC